MKKEIKKLQRVREYFRLSLNKPEITDKSRLLEGKKKIEQVSAPTDFINHFFLTEVSLNFCLPHLNSNWSNQNYR